jgi:hypothetical protein
VSKQDPAPNPLDGLPEPDAVGVPQWDLTGRARYWGDVCVIEARGEVLVCVGAVVVPGAEVLEVLARLAGGEG